MAPSTHFRFRQRRLLADAVPVLPSIAGIVMEVLYPRCAGLDVHKDSVVACFRAATRQGVQTEIARFGTTTESLLALSDWLAARECTHVALEATGVYWKPVWHVLDGSFELILANAGHIRNVPGRKTDVNDATWIAELLAHGLIRGSFVPPTAIQDLRDLTRTRKQLVREVGQHTQRIQKVLEDANIKLASVVTDILGQSGRKVLHALIAGESNPETLTAMTSQRLKADRAAIGAALRGHVREHHRVLLRIHLGLIDTLQATIADLERRLGKEIEIWQEHAELLKTMPGVGDTVAEVILAEIGPDMSRFPTADHLVSWAGLCPRSDESAGKRRSTRLRPGAPWLKTTLVQAGWAAVHKKSTYLKAQFLRLKSRRGPKKAIMAVAASMLRSVWYMLTRHEPYRDLGIDHFNRIEPKRSADRLVRRLNGLGFQVTLSPTDRPVSL